MLERQSIQMRRPHIHDAVIEQMNEPGLRLLIM